jgi:tripeptide aminopeptidase
VPYYQQRTTEMSELLNQSIISKESRARLFECIDQRLSDYIGNLIRICEVPAPGFREQRRASVISELFRASEFSPESDAAGNVRVPVLRNGKPHLVVSAHLDTVSPLEEIRVKRNGALLLAPGVSDDSAGLSALVLLARAFRTMPAPESGSLTMVATVGEEGLGNLRGSRFLFESDKTIDGFLSLDGADPERVIVAGLASKRLRIRFRGPGGHSWGDAGVANPIHVAGEFLHRLNEISLSPEPKTTLNVGVIHGGTSVNAIPTDVSLDVDLRSESAAHLQALDRTLAGLLSATTKQHDSITGDWEVLGERPAGYIAKDHRMLKIVSACNAEFGFATTFESASTDSNIPFAAGIPALTLGVGGRSGKIHTPEEWYDPTGADQGLKRTALLILELLRSPF